MYFVLCMRPERGVAALRAILLIGTLRAQEHQMPGKARAGADPLVAPTSAASPAQAATGEIRPGYGEVPYRLGAGGVITLSLYGKPEFARPPVSIGPDGTISYLSATGFPVRGITLDEAMQAVEKALSNYYRAPRVVIVPVQLVSKSYTIMGMIKLSCVFPLDQPLTLLEALARSGGTVSGLFDRRYVDLADLERSFIIRDGRKFPVNFRKLLLEGDLSQNIPLAPRDLIASALANDDYVLGAVCKPGARASRRVKPCLRVSPSGQVSRSRRIANVYSLCAKA